MAEQQPQIALLGAGIFVRNTYIPRLAEISNSLNLRAIWSRSEESARVAHEMVKKLFHGVECKWGEAGLEEIIGDASITGVLVVLAGQAQVDVSLRFLRAGKHVLQEKPAAASVDEIEKAISCYNSLEFAPFWGVAENYRFEPAFLEGSKLMDEIGNIINVHVIAEGSMSSSNPYFSSSWRRDFVGGFILDMGVHFISAMRMLIDSEVTSVAAITTHVDSNLPPPDHISSTIVFENGSSGVFVMVVSSRSPKVLWRIVGLNGTLQIERGTKDGKHGYTVSLFLADGQNKSWFHPFSGVTNELEAFLSDISLAALKVQDDYGVTKANDHIANLYVFLLGRRMAATCWSHDFLFWKELATFLFWMQCLNPAGEEACLFRLESSSLTLRIETGGIRQLGTVRPNYFNLGEYSQII